MPKKPTCSEPRQLSERSELNRSIAAAFVSLTCICALHTSARAHYDLQDHRLYDSARSHDAIHSKATTNSKTHTHVKHKKPHVHSNSKYQALDVTSPEHAKASLANAHMHNSQKTHSNDHVTVSKVKKLVASTKTYSNNRSVTAKSTSKPAPHAVSLSRHQNRTHAHTQSGFDPWRLLEQAITSPAYAFSGHVSITLQGPFRVIRSNGLPDHQTGAFPNEGNPNTITEQHYEYRVPKDPKKTGQTTPLGMNAFGVAINGVPFDPGAAEWYDGDPRSGWQYEAMYLGARLGIDQNNAHVQPNGAYHYHGIPTGLMQKLASYGKPVLIGYAADGFPIYGPFGYKNPMDKNSGLKNLKPSYRFKNGSRPSNPGPGGRYDGAFTEDFEYAKSLGDLDDSNGRFGVTPEYPQGIYHYVVTDHFPFIPRSYKGSPDESFQKRRPGGGFRTGAQTRYNSSGTGQRRQQGGNLWGRPAEDDDFRGPGDGFGPPDGGPRGRGGPGRGGGPPPRGEGGPGRGGPPDRDGGPPGRGSFDRDGGPPGRGGEQGPGDMERDLGPPGGGPPGRRPPPPGRMENGDRSADRQGNRPGGQQGRGQDDFGPPPFGPPGNGGGRPPGPPPEGGDGPPGFGPPPGDSEGPPPFGPPPGRRDGSQAQD